MSVTVEALEFKDIESASDLLHRFWSLNSEFEPGIEVGAVLGEIKEDVKTGLADKNQLILVARSDQRLIGVLRAEVVRNRSYGSKPIGKIVEFYVAPNHRRIGAGEALLDTVLSKLMERGIELVTAEFPTQNVVATSFYEKKGFGPFFAIYSRSLTKS